MEKVEEAVLELKDSFEKLKKNQEAIPNLAENSIYRDSYAKLKEEIVNKIRNVCMVYLKNFKVLPEYPEIQRLHTIINNFGGNMKYSIFQKTDWKLVQRSMEQFVKDFDEWFDEYRYWYFMRTFNSWLTDFT